MKSLLSIFSAVKRALLVVNNVHGGGFDGDWTLEIRQLKSKTYVVLHGSYHMMNQDGYYDGWADFEVRIPTKHTDGWRICWGVNAPWYKIYKYMLTDCIEDIIADHISNYETSLMQSRLQISKCYYFKGILK